IQDDQLRQVQGGPTEGGTLLTRQMAMGFAEAYDQVSILFSDVVAFTAIGSSIEPEELVQLLNELFTLFDDIAEECGLEKIKTIGDAYMAAAGLPRHNPMHAHATARMGLMMIE
ncbi:Nitrogen permease regulator 2, partial [Perkinsus olseni]